MHGAGDDVGVVGTAVVEPITFNADTTAAYQIAIKITVIEIGRTGRERSATGVNETAAVTTDTSRIGNNHLCPRTGHFYKAAQMTGIAGIDFVDNDTRTTSA